MTRQEKGRAVGLDFPGNIQNRRLEITTRYRHAGHISGEVEREDSALDCARRKCLCGIEESGASTVWPAKVALGRILILRFYPVTEKSSTSLTAGTILSRMSLASLTKPTTAREL